MITSLLRVSSGAPTALHSGALQTLLQQSTGAYQELNLLQAWPGTPSCSSNNDSDAHSQLSTSYTLHPQRHLVASRPHRHAPPFSPLQSQLHINSTPSSLAQMTLQLQQLRCYRIPNRVSPPKVAYSIRSGRPAPQPWPEFETVKAPQGEVRWHRSVVRFPQEVTAQLEEASSGTSSGSERTLVLSGKAGTIRLSLQDLDPTGLLAFRLLHVPTTNSADPVAASAASSPSPNPTPQRGLLVLASPNKARFDAAVEAVNRALRGVISGYLVGLMVKGVGYRMEPVEDPTGEVARRLPKLTYAQLKRRARAPGGAAPKPYFFEDPGEDKQNFTFPYNKPVPAIRLKVGYSRTVVYPLPPHVRAFCLKPTLLYLYALELDELQRVAAEIRSIRKPNPYTGNGVQYVDEVVKIKQRARSK